MVDEQNFRSDDCREVYEDTLYFVDGLTNEYDFYPAILAMFSRADMSLELKKQYVMKAVDELWVKTIEEALPALDTVIRSPSRFIEDNEVVLPIEMSRNITSRSIVHLSQHTDYISKIEGDDITPSKILNVYRDETLMTYENKFVNTLISRLYSFIARRYDEISGKSASEKKTVLNFSGDFNHGTVRGKLNFGIEVTEEPEKSSELNVRYNCLDLAERVKRLYDIASAYTNSDFAKNMGKAYIKPPVMRTNAIMKNKDLKVCLALWQFIESYEGVGYEVYVQQNAEKVDEEYTRELYSTCALQYLIFRYKIQPDFDPDNTLAFDYTREALKPRFVSDIKPIDADEFNVFDTRYMRTVPYSKVSAKRHMSNDEKRIGDEIDILLAADMLLEELREKERLERERLAREAEEQRLREEEEARRRAEEQAAFEAAELERRRLLREKEEAERLAELERARLLKEQEEAERLAELERARLRKERGLDIKDRHVGRKKKKKIRRTAEIKAEKVGATLSPTFNYVEYMRFIKDDTITGEQDDQE